MNRFVSIAAGVLFLGACATPDLPVADTASVAPTSQPDPYLWLEDVTGARAMDWVNEQNKRSLGALTGNDTFKQLYDEALQILGSEERIPEGSINAGFVYNFWQDTAHVRGLWRRADHASFTDGKPQWQTLIDVDALAEREHRNWVFGGANCLPPAYERCMIELSDGGTDASDYREFSITDLAFVEGGFVLPEAKSSVTWIDENSLLVATDYGADTITDSGYPFEVRRLARGQTLAQAPAFFKGKKSDVGVFATTLRDDDRTWPVAAQAQTFFEFAMHVEINGELVSLPLPKRVSLVGMIDGQIIAHLRQEWEHEDQSYQADSLISLTARDDGGFASTLIYAPSASEALEQVVAGQDDLYVVLLDDVIGTLKRLSNTPSGWQVSEVPLPSNGTVSITSANGKGNDLLVSYESMTVPDSLFYVAQDNNVTTVQSLPQMYDASDVLVEQHFAVSSDGTRVPYFLMGRKDVLARGNAPTIQYGYGGFQASILPSYYEDPARPQHGALAGRLWVSRGGVIALSNIRGGGEYGPAWHEAALKENRQLAFDDFFAIGDDLVARGVTTPQKLGAIGRSNGGLLMGVALIQRPDLYAAVDCGVPLLDMLRYHKLLAGASWMGEYGNPDIEGERAYIAQYSPYQALQRNAKLPDVLFYTSTKDDRVHPGHARKMAAKMDAYGYPFYYYENTEGGHGGTANQDQLAYRTALEYMFFVETLMN